MSAGQMIFCSGKPEEQAKIQVEISAPERYKVVVEQLDLKPEAKNVKTMQHTEFLDKTVTLKWVRPIINLDIYGFDQQRDPNKRLEVEEFKNDITIVIRYPESDLKKVGYKLENLKLLFWDPNNGKGKWIPHDNLLNKEITDFKRAKGFFSFKVLKWPLDDREIGSGG